MSLKHWLWVALLFSGAGFAAPPPLLRVAVSAAWAMPVGVVENGSLERGIVFDIYREVAVVLGRDMKQVVLPRKRLGAGGSAGEFDLRCHVTHDWVDAPGLFEWTRPLYTVEDVLFGVRRQSAPASVAALPQHTAVTTVLGYRYQAIEPLFAAGQLVRDDSPDESKVLHKVTAGRAEFGVVSSFVLHWYRKSNERHGLANWALPIDSTPIRCAILKEGNVAPKVLREAIEQLILSGKIEQILARYR